MSTNARGTIFSISWRLSQRVSYKSTFQISPGKVSSSLTFETDNCTSGTVTVKTWSSFVEGVEGLNQPTSQTNLAIVLLELSQLFWHFINTITLITTLVLH